MHPTHALARLGGVGHLRTLQKMTSRRRLRTSLHRGEIVKVGRGHYALPTAAQGLKAAARLSGVASHRTAATIHGWEIATQPDRPDVIVPRHRKVESARRHGVQVRWRSLEPHEQHGLVTSPLRTVVDCAKDLTFSEALAVTDSALRHGDVDGEQLQRLAASLRGPGRGKVARVAAQASGLADNPFESVLRAIALGVPGLDVEPQVVIEEPGFRVRPDLVDEARRLVIEADSFEFHTGRRAFRRDCERYTGLVLRGWVVVRFAWEHVMFEPEYVHECLVALVEGPQRRAQHRLGLPRTG